MGKEVLLKLFSDSWTSYKLMLHWTIFSDDLPRYDVATNIIVMYHVTANNWTSLRSDIIVMYHVTANNWTSLRSDMLHWNDSERNIVADRIIENRLVWHYL